MAALDLLGRRWALRILWELRDGPLGFRPLSAACGGISPTVLNKRLRELREAKLVSLDDDGYALSRGGRELYEALSPLQRWSERWQRSLAAD